MPERVRVLDALVVEIGRDLVLVVDEFAVGLDNRDAGRIANTGRSREGAAAKVVEANREMIALAPG